MESSGAAPAPTEKRFSVGTGATQLGGEFIKVAGYHAAHYVRAKFPHPNCDVLLEYRSSLLLAKNKAKHKLFGRF